MMKFFLFLMLTMFFSVSANAYSNCTAAQWAEADAVCKSKGWGCANACDADDLGLWSLDCDDPDSMVAGPGKPIDKFSQVDGVKTNGNISGIKKIKREVPGHSKHKVILRKRSKK